MPSHTFVEMKIYIVWVKGKKVTLKILQAELLASISREDLTYETLVKSTVWHDSSASNMCFSRALFMGYSPCGLVAKLHLFLI